MSKPKVIKAYNALEEDIRKQLKLNYPYGFDKYLISFTDAKGKIITALPYETDKSCYLIKMTSSMAIDIIKGDSDYDVDGHLTSEAKEEIIGEMVMDLPEEELILELEVQETEE